MRYLLVALCALLASPAHAAPADSLEILCAKFSNFDRNGDGQLEIQSLQHIATVGDRGERVVMLVERRLLAPTSRAQDLDPVVKRWADDLQYEGYRASVVAVELAPSDLHQDGQYLLAIREFLRAVNKDKSLAGVVLVGRFPDSSIVRTCNWRRRANVTLRKGQPDAKTYKGGRYLHRSPELVAPRADIVLADLDGNWEDIYVQPPTELESVKAVFAEGKVPEKGGPCIDLQVSTATFTDFFHVSDGAVRVVEARGTERRPVPARVIIRDQVGNYECSRADGRLPNGLAQPDIFVSRIDARGVALSPREDITGVDGAKLLDAEGKPQVVKFASKKEVPRWDRVWQHDEALERRLLAEYFDRNHTYRTGQTSVSWRPASIACELPSGFRSMSRAATNWERGDRRVADLRGKPTLVDFVEWIKYPAILRTVRAHSHPSFSQFGKVDAAQLDAMLDGPAWSWTQKGDRLEPSLAAACGRGALNWFLLRSLWEHGQMASEPTFYHHTGCNAISPPGVSKHAYDHPEYGLRQGAESLLMYGNGLALIGRSKVYYDEPRGFAEALREGHTYGKAWSEYFRIEATTRGEQAPGPSVDRKRAYFWSVLGDWTLRLATAAPGEENNAVAKRD